MLYPAELRAPGRAIAAAMSVRASEAVCAGGWVRWAAAALLASGVVDAATAQELRLADGRSAVLGGHRRARAAPAPGLRAGPDRSAGRARSTGMAACAASCGDRTVPGCRRRWSSAGLAVVDPAADVAPDTLAELLRLEREARAARRGVGPTGAWARMPAEQGRGRARHLRPGARHRALGLPALRPHLSRFRRGLAARLHGSGRYQSNSPTSPATGLTSRPCAANGSWCAAGCSGMPGRWSSSCIARQIEVEE